MLYPAELRALLARYLSPEGCESQPRNGRTAAFFPGFSTGCGSFIENAGCPTAFARSQEPRAPRPVEMGNQTKFLEETMNRLAIAMLLLASPAFAQNTNVAPDLRDCPPTGQTAKGELVYSLDCKALKAENKEVNYKPDMPATNLPETVIPKSGATQTPETTPTKAK
jgi:hypothetical protein